VQKATDQKLKKKRFIISQQKQKTATPRRPTDHPMEKPMKDWSVAEWVAFMKGKTRLE
jgi:hypothetical protein